MWPFSRRRDPGRRAPSGPVLRQSTAAQPWRDVPALAPAVTPIPLLLAPQRFAGDLTSWQPPRPYLAPLGHTVSASAPAGAVAGLARTTERPAAEHSEPSLLLRQSQPPAPIVQRSFAQPVRALRPPVPVSPPDEPPPQLAAPEVTLPEAIAPAGQPALPLRIVPAVAPASPAHRTPLATAATLDVPVLRLAATASAPAAADGPASPPDTAIAPAQVQDSQGAPLLGDHSADADGALDSPATSPAATAIVPHASPPAPGSPAMPLAPPAGSDLGERPATSPTMGPDTPVQRLVAPQGSLVGEPAQHLRRRKLGLGEPLHQRPDGSVQDRGPAHDVPPPQPSLQRRPAAPPPQPAPPDPPAPTLGLGPPLGSSQQARTHPPADDAREATAPTPAPPATPPPLAAAAPPQPPAAPAAGGAPAGGVGEGPVQPAAAAAQDTYEPDAAPPAQHDDAGTTESQLPAQAAPESVVAPLLGGVVAPLDAGGQDGPTSGAGAPLPLQRSPATGEPAVASAPRRTPGAAPSPSTIAPRPTMPLAAGAGSESGATATPPLGGTHRSSAPPLTAVMTAAAAGGTGGLAAAVGLAGGDAAGQSARTAPLLGARVPGDAASTAAGTGGMPLQRQVGPSPPADLAPRPAGAHLRPSAAGQAAPTGSTRLLDPVPPPAWPAVSDHRAPPGPSRSAGAAVRTLPVVPPAASAIGARVVQRVASGLAATATGAEPWDPVLASGAADGAAVPGAGAPLRASHRGVPVTAHSTSASPPPLALQRSQAPAHEPPSQHTESPGLASLFAHGATHPDGPNSIEIPQRLIDGGAAPPTESREQHDGEGEERRETGEGLGHPRTWDAETLDELGRRLYSVISRRIKQELRTDRERAGRLMDLRR